MKSGVSASAMCDEQRFHHDVITDRRAVGGPRFSRRGVSVLLALWSVSVAACGLSPVEPTGADRDIQFVVTASEPLRSGASVVYTFSFTVANPSYGSTVHVNSLEFVVLGPNNVIYATVPTPLNTDLTPGSSIGGGASPYFDSNVARPLATRCTGRLSFTRSDGTRVTVEREAPIAPLR